MSRVLTNCQNMTHLSTRSVTNSVDHSSCHFCRSSWPCFIFALISYLSVYYLLFCFQPDGVNEVHTVFGLLTPIHKPLPVCWNKTFEFHIHISAHRFLALLADSSNETSDSIKTFTFTHSKRLQCTRSIIISLALKTLINCICSPCPHSISSWTSSMLQYIFCPDLPSDLPHYLQIIPP